MAKDLNRICKTTRAHIYIYIYQCLARRTDKKNRWIFLQARYERAGTNRYSTVAYIHYILHIHVVCVCLEKLLKKWGGKVFFRLWRFAYRWDNLYFSLRRFWGIKSLFCVSCIVYLIFTYSYIWKATWIRLHFFLNYIYWPKKILIIWCFCVATMLYYAQTYVSF